jgi:hypothetical protein
MISIIIEAQVRRFSLSFVSFSCLELTAAGKYHNLKWKLLNIPIHTGIINRQISLLAQSQTGKEKTAFTTNEQELVIYLQLVIDCGITLSLDEGAVHKLTKSAIIILFANNSLLKTHLFYINMHSHFAKHH